MNTVVDFHFDPMCPFAYQTSLWIRDVREQLGITVNWRFFSLEEINRVEGKKHPWERDWSYGWSLMRIGALLGRTDMSLLDRWYAAIGHELHVAGGKPHDPAVARRLLSDIGVDAAVFDAALDDPTTHDDIRADHQRVVDAGGYGVPTLFLFGAVSVWAGTGGSANRTGRPDTVECRDGYGRTAARLRTSAAEDSGRRRTHRPESASIPRWTRLGQHQSR